MAFPASDCDFFGWALGRLFNAVRGANAPPTVAGGVMIPKSPNSPTHGILKTWHAEAPESSQNDCNVAPPLSRQKAGSFEYTRKDRRLTSSLARRLPCSHLRFSEGAVRRRRGGRPLLRLVVRQTLASWVSYELEPGCPAMVSRLGLGSLKLCSPRAASDRPRREASPPLLLRA